MTDMAHDPRAAALALKTVLDLAIADSTDPFAQVGVSEQFMNTTLDGPPVSLEVAKQMSANIDHAIATNNIAKINEIGKIAKSVLTSGVFAALKGVFA